VVTIFHEDVTFILTPEIPNPAHVMLDDCSMKGPATCYESPDGSPEVLADNLGIRRFIWEHLRDVHHIFHQLICAGATVSAPKLSLAVPEVVILGHKCNYQGCIPDNSKIAKIWDWLPCKSVTDVCAFLGITGYMHIWICNYATIAHPLVLLTHKGQPFTWTEEQEAAMQALKSIIIHSPVLISINYQSDRPVYLAVDSSVRGVGWILSQDCADGSRHPARFGSIAWNEHEARYFQAKLELYRLFCALCATCLHIIGIWHLVVEMDAIFIHSMLRNPDIQPNATINRWIVAILLFDFKLVHIPADKHRGPDGLSWWEPVAGEDNDEDDPDDWVDCALSLGAWVLSWVNRSSLPSKDDTTSPPPLCRSSCL